MRPVNAQKIEFKVRLSKLADPDLLRLCEVVGKKSFVKIAKESVFSAFETPKTFDVENWINDIPSKIDDSIEFTIKFNCSPDSPLYNGLLSIKESKIPNSTIIKDIIRHFVGMEFLLGLCNVDVIAHNARKEIILHTKTSIDTKETTQDVIQIPLQDSSAATLQPTLPSFKLKEKEDQSQNTVPSDDLTQTNLPIPSSEDTSIIQDTENNDDDDDVFDMLAAMM